MSGEGFTYSRIQGEVFYEENIGSVEKLSIPFLLHNDRDLYNICTWQLKHDPKRTFQAFM